MLLTLMITIHCVQGWNVFTIAHKHLTYQRQRIQRQAPSSKHAERACDLESVRYSNPLCTLVNDERRPDYNSLFIGLHVTRIEIDI